MLKRGVFITFEGCEGSGKSTQVPRIAHRLEALGHRVHAFREPGGTSIGEEVRKLLLRDDLPCAMTPETELFLFAASRAQLVREMIRPALKRNEIVLCDRFLDSTTVYQEVARALPRAEVHSINALATGESLPDLTILLDIEAEVGQRRAMSRKGKNTPEDRIEKEPMEFHETVRRAYQHLPKIYPERNFIQINAFMTPEDVENKIMQAIENYLQEHI